jgi:hypothetical protein
MAKYDPLAAFLAASTTPTVTLSFRQVELILGEPLPFSARNYREWWANNTTNHVNSQSWLGAGWRVAERGINMEQETVTFVMG